MKKILLWLVVLATLSGSALCAQDIAGNWQGTLHAGKGLRTVLKISKADNGGWNAMLYSIDQGPEGMPVTSITLQGSTLKFSIDPIHGAYEGKVSADGNSIVGTWTQGPPLPLNFQRATKATAWPLDTSPHTVQFITVDNGVKLEVLDWGGSGRPIVLLAGLGNTAHVFDQFAPKLATSYHIYGITRRGFGASSAPTAANGNYSADRLGDDVLVVMAALKLTRPVLVGHSIAGEELSSIGSRYPDKIAGLIYLDAGYPYAYYDRVRGDFPIDAIYLRRQLDLFLSGGVRDPKQFAQELQASLPQFEKDLQEFRKRAALMPAPPANSGNPHPIEEAIMAGEQKYTQIKCPVLAIFADPHDLGSMFKDDPPAVRAAAQASDLASTTAQAKAFQAGIPSDRSMP